MPREPNRRVGRVAIRETDAWSRRRAFVLIVSSSIALWSIILGTGWGISSAIDRSSELLFLNETAARLFHTGAGILF